MPLTQALLVKRSSESSQAHTPLCLLLHLLSFSCFRPSPDLFLALCLSLPSYSGWGWGGQRSYIPVLHNHPTSRAVVNQDDEGHMSQLASTFSPPVTCFFGSRSRPTADSSDVGTYVVCLCGPPRAFYLLTLRTSIPVQRDLPTKFTKGY